MNNQALNAIKAVYRQKTGKSSPVIKAMHRTKATEYRIKGLIDSMGGQISVPQIAQELALPLSTVRGVIKRKGWNVKAHKEVTS